jgi:hypothetical protein
MTEIHSFSGTHAFHPTVWADTDADHAGDDHPGYLTELIESGWCPRCSGPLPTGREFPAGSRITPCRSIPICGSCGSDEAFEQMEEMWGIGWGLSPASAWPVYDDDIDARRERILRQSTPAILTPDGQLITDDGVAEVVNPCNTGGWAQYGTAEG